MPNPADREGITMMVASKGNIRALTLCLFSVMNSRRVPQNIMVRLEGDIPGMSDFYLEQAAEFARMAGIRFSVTVAASEGVRAARDWMLDFCPTNFLWMLDDDVIVAPDCLVSLCASDTPQGTAAIQGVKSDLNNRRGYKDFFKGVHPRSELGKDASPNHRYDQLPDTLSAKTRLPVYEIATIDTGNVLFCMEEVRAAKSRFQVFEDSTNSGGEDTLFAMQLLAQGKTVQFCPWAVSYHLEKPDIRFDEFSARGEAVSRSMDVLGMPPELKERLKKNLMPWIWPQQP